MCLEILHVGLLHLPRSHPPVRGRWGGFLSLISWAPKVTGNCDLRSSLQLLVLTTFPARLRRGDDSWCLPPVEKVQVSQVPRPSCAGPDSHNHPSVCPSSSTVGDLGNTHAEAVSDRECVLPLTREQRHAYDLEALQTLSAFCPHQKPPVQSLREADVSSSTGAEGGEPILLQLLWEEALHRPRLLREESPLHCR